MNQGSFGDKIKAFLGNLFGGNKQQKVQATQPTAQAIQPKIEEKKQFVPTMKLPYDEQTARQIASTAKDYGMTPSEMFASLYQESSFGSNPNAKKENYATALGDLQITRPYTEKNNSGLPSAYPGYPELYIEPDDRLDLMKSVDFRGKHFKRFMDNFNDRDKALNAYYGDDTYAPKIRQREQEEIIKQLLMLIGEQ